MKKFSKEFALVYSRLTRALFCVVLGVVACSGQGSPLNPELSRRIENRIRTDFNLPPSVQITINPARASDFAGYEVLPVMLENSERKATIEFLLSKDLKTLARLDKMDVSTDARNKMDLTGRPERGNKDAKVTIVTYDDFQCPYCARMHQTLFTDIPKVYGDKVKVIYKDYPLSFHPWASHAAVDANCLNSQNSVAYWNFADYVHASQKEINSAGAEKRPLADQAAALDTAAREQARKLSLDIPKLDACMKAQDDSAVKVSIKEAEALGVDSTPTLFINGEKIAAALPIELLRPIIDRALRDAGVPVPAPSNAATHPQDSGSRGNGPDALPAKK